MKRNVWACNISHILWPTEALLVLLFSVFEGLQGNFLIIGCHHIMKENEGQSEHKQTIDMHTFYCLVYILLVKVIKIIFLYIAMSKSLPLNNMSCLLHTTI